MCFVPEIAKLECKDTAIPESPLADIGLCGNSIWFLFERLYRGYQIWCLRDDIPVLLTRISRFNAHQSQMKGRIFCQIRKLLQGFEIVFLNIRIHRTHNNRFLLRNVLYIMQISTC